MSTKAKSSHLRLIDGDQRGRSPASAQPLQSEPALDPTEALESPVSQGRVARSAFRPLLELSDAQLVRLALDDQPGAFEALYRRHVSFAIHLATRIEGSKRDVEDVVHDAFIKAMNRLADLSDPAAFRSWLGSIVVYAVRSRLRRQRLMNVLGLGRGADPIELDSLTSPQASPMARAQLAQVYALLRTRPTDDRIAWTLRYVEGHELEAVGKLVGCSLATVKRRISRAQQFLESHFVSPEGATPAPPEAEATDTTSAVASPIAVSRNGASPRSKSSP